MSALGISEKVTPAIFNAIHKQKNYLLTPQAQADFLATQGVDKKQFTDAYNSFSVQGEVNQSAKLLKDYAIDGVPTVVVQVQDSPPTRTASGHGPGARLPREAGSGQEALIPARAPA